MMARRKSKAKQQEEFIQAIFGLLMFVSIFGTFGLTKSLQATLIVTVFSVVVFISVLILNFESIAS